MEERAGFDLGVYSGEDAEILTMQNNEGVNPKGSGWVAQDSVFGRSSTCRLTSVSIKKAAQ